LKSIWAHAQLVRHEPKCFHGCDIKFLM